MITKELEMERDDFKELNYFVLSSGTDEEYTELLNILKFYDRIRKKRSRKAGKRICKGKELQSV